MKNYRLKILDNAKVTLKEEKDSVAFVKMYLFENAIIEPLEKHYILQQVKTKCQGAKVYALMPKKQEVDKS